jgi:hypothetical protein
LSFSAFNWENRSARTPGGRRQAIRHAFSGQRRAAEHWLAVLKQNDLTACFVDHDKDLVAVFNCYLANAFLLVRQHRRCGGLLGARRLIALDIGQRGRRAWAMCAARPGRVDMRTRRCGSCIDGFCSTTGPRRGFTGGYGERTSTTDLRKRDRGAEYS